MSRRADVRFSNCKLTQDAALARSREIDALLLLPPKGARSQPLLGETLSNKVVVVTKDSLRYTVTKSLEHSSARSALNDGEVVERKPTESKASSKIADHDKWSQIDAYFAKLARACVADPHIIDTIESTGMASAFVRELLGVDAAQAQQAVPTDALPDVAPALWAKDKRAGETPPDFIRRVYEPWIGKGLARSDLRGLDPQLYMALANWLRKNEMPGDIDLPTVKQVNDRWVEKITGSGTDRSAVNAQEIIRLGTVLKTRASRSRD